MSFPLDLQRWTARAILQSSTKADENIRRLLRGDDTGPLSPIGRQGLSPDRREERPPDREPTGAAVPPGSWIYYPISDDAPYSWGDPYTTELGTVLAGSICPGGANSVVDKSKHPYRLYDEDADTVTHGTNQMAGRGYWKHDDYVLTWNAPLGAESISPQFNDGELRGIYRNGAVMAYTLILDFGGFDNPMEPKAAAIRHEAGTNYLYVSTNAAGSGYDGRFLLMRAVVDPYGTEQTLSWQLSLTLNTLLQGLTPPFNNDNPLVASAFNKSCTRMILTQPGRVVEVDISTWGAETIVRDDYFGNMIELGPQPEPVGFWGPGTGVIPVISGYQTDSDTRRDLTVEISHSGHEVDTSSTNICSQPEAVITATLKEDGTPINSWELYRYVQDVGQENAFITVNPFFQCVQGRVYCVDYYRARIYADPDPQGYVRRYQREEVYREGTLFYSRDLVEHHPDPGTGEFLDVDFREFTLTGARSVRDLSTYPQCNRSPNWTWAWILNENVMSWLLGECIGYHLSVPSAGTHGASGFFTSADSVSEPTYGSVTFNGINHFAFATRWDGAFVYSRRVFNDWIAVGDPAFVWENVGTIDLLQKTGAVGDNQHLMVRGCNTLPDELRPNLAQIGLYHVSTDTPFPP